MWKHYYVLYVCVLSKNMLQFSEQITVGVYYPKNTLLKKYILCLAVSFKVVNRQDGWA